MGYQNRRLSLCHFAPTIIGYYNTETGQRTQDEEFTRKSIAVKSGAVSDTVLCEFCNKPCEFVPDFEFDDMQLELTVRRYKDSDLLYEDVQDIIHDMVKASVIDLLGRVGDLKNKK